MAGQDKFEAEKKIEDSIEYNSPKMISDWRFSDVNLTNTPIGEIPLRNPMAVCRVDDLLDSSSCSSASMVDSFCPTIWDQQINSHNLNLGFCGINSATTSNTLGFRKGSIERTLDIGWTPPNSILRGGMLMSPIASKMIPQSISDNPADSGFIERAARFSCFSGGSFVDMMNPLCINESLSHYARGVESMQGPQEVFVGNELKSFSCEKKELMGHGSQECGATEGSPLNNERMSETLLRTNDEAKQGESDEAEISGQEEQSLLEGQSSKRRRRSGQESEFDQVKGVPQAPDDAVIKDNPEIQQKGDQIQQQNRTTGKNGKQGPQASDSKEEYIHVRARRGQATNSHSLAERVRREKISERMKFLQDLVPGCSKVTGKAVMLDEIINYVQSLQRQVEFLSKKLATVNPRLDFNMEALLGKDILHSRAGTSSTLGFPPDMNMSYPLVHASQPGLVQSSLSGMRNSSDGLQRTINSHLTSISGGFKEPTSQVPNVWEDELHNVVQMAFNSSAPLEGQDLSGTRSEISHIKYIPL